MVVDVEIICPKCGERAGFAANMWSGYVPHPSRKGRLVCTGCGLNKKYAHTLDDYYYKIPVGNRTLYARTIEKLVELRDYL